ncbi:snaclec 3-like, partial [Mizuhopecten yessoensis]|uniref:snaclec 3-like n=1 Tax=Mizuhopecten yessoensis TaxID=6573 RepID=UPI000B459301
MYSDSRIYLTTLVCILSVLQTASAQCGPLEVGNDNACVDMKWCLYKLYKNPMNWADARQICSQEGHDLLRITDAVEHTYLNSFLVTSLGIASPAVPVDTTIWLGMQQNAGDNPRWHNDCSTQPAGYNPVPNVAGSNCFMLDIMANTYAYADCSSSKMFLCKAKSYELSTCFTSVSTMTDATLSAGTYQGMTAATDCAGRCSEANCVGYRYYPNSACVLGLASLGKVYTKGGTDKYMK